jgi:hypothetical protein
MPSFRARWRLLRFCSQLAEGVSRRDIARQSSFAGLYSITPFARQTDWQGRPNRAAFTFHFAGPKRILDSALTGGPLTSYVKQKRGGPIC